jgi:hypothetical protein
MQTFYYTIRGAKSEQDAQQFLLNILMQEYSGTHSDFVKAKGFTRRLEQFDVHINARIEKMHKDSLTEYSFGGFSDDSKKSSDYTFWGVTL